MIDSPATNYIFQPLVPTRNQVVHRQPAPNPLQYPNRSQLRFRLKLYIQAFFRSNTYTLVTTDALEASELPPTRYGTQLVYRGAPFELQQLLDSFLTLTPPTFRQQRISLAEGLTRQYYTERDVFNGLMPITSQQSGIVWAIKAGIQETDRLWVSKLFTDSSALAGRFLTWQPDHKRVLPDQPEYLYFLANQQPAPAVLRLRAELTYTDGSMEVVTLFEQTEVTSMSVYCLPVGPIMLGTMRPSVRQYAVWVSDEGDNRLSDVRTFLIDSTYYPQTRYLLFDNSLGGFDTLALTGRGTEKLSTKRAEAERGTAVDGRATFAERIVTGSESRRELTVHTGYLRPDERTWLVELALAQQVFLVSDRGHIPVLSRAENYVQQQDDETLIGRQFQFQYSNREYNHSVLPAPTVGDLRPTKWNAYDTACELTANGIRTGRQLCVLKRLVYVDTNQPVEPELITPNLPGDEAYIDPIVSVSCTLTPYYNTRLSLAGTYAKSDCPNTNQVGSSALIVVDARLFGSELNQADADAKAMAFWQTINTQAFADQTGACVVGQYQSALLSQLGTFFRDTCIPSTHIGQRALIVIPAGQYGSNISQADADNKALMQYNFLNTQATANELGACMPRQQVIATRGGYNMTFYLEHLADNSYVLSYSQQWGWHCTFSNLPAGATLVGNTITFPASFFNTSVSITVVVDNASSGIGGNNNTVQDQFNLTFTFF